jgi:MGT family glycosyltransferase
MAPASLAPDASPLSRFRATSVDAAGGEPLVYVSFGSEAPRTAYFPALYRGAAEALATLGLPVLMTIGDERDPAELGALPPSVRVERWVPQASVMPRAAAMVGHAGSGSTLAALAAGVPSVLLPLFADGGDNARRVAERGAAVALDGGMDALPRLAEAVARVVESRRHRDAAAEVAAEIAALPVIDAAVGVVAAAALGAGRRGGADAGNGGH